MSEIVTGEVWLGIDPDLHSTALATADDKRVYKVGVIRSKGGVLDMLAAIENELPRFVGLGRPAQGKELVGIVVEGQKYILGGKAEKATPEDLIKLAMVAASALSVCGMVGDFKRENPLPQEWKGSQEKFKHQVHTCMKYGWRFDKKGGMKPYAVPYFQQAVAEPTGASELNAGDWKHVLDAIGLARWGSCRATPERLGIV